MDHICHHQEWRDQDQAGTCVAILHTCNCNTTSFSAAPAPAPPRAFSARMKVNARAAQYRATLAGLTTSPATGDPTSASLGVTLLPQHPLHIHPSPDPDSGKRQVISVGRGKVPAHSFLNLDGSTLPPSSLSSAPATALSTTVTPWAPHLLINATTNTPNHADPQAAARLLACGLCRAGACLPSATTGRRLNVM